MGQSLDLAGVIGTWVAAGLAIAALVGIITPWLLLREARSKRFEALNTVDSQDTGFISGGFRLRSTSKYFQRVNMPLLRDPPAPGLQIRLCESSSSSPSSTIQTLGSATGWVNLAAIINAYVPDLKRGDQLMISEHESFLPVHRFWILAFGLLGRYGKRADFGRAINNSNAMRLMIEGHRNFNANSRELYSGLTGMLFWFPMTPEVASMTSVKDTLYFKLHSIESREALSPDPMPLSLLFWLALGCLPLSEDRVFDLAKFRPALRSRKPDKRNAEKVSFFRYRERSGIRVGQSHWADSMGIDMAHLWCSEKTDIPSNVDEITADAEAEKGEWFVPPTLLSSSSLSLPLPRRRFFWRTDIHHLALGLVTMPISPLGFIFDYSRSLHKDLFGLVTDCLDNYLEWTKTNSQQLGFSEEDLAIVLELSRMRDRANFSRRRIRAHFALDRALAKRQWKISEHARHIISVLAITSQEFRLSLMTALEHSNAPLTSVSPALAPSQAPSSSSPSHQPFSSLQWNFAQKSVTIQVNIDELSPPAQGSTTTKELVQRLDFPSVFPSAPPPNGNETYSFSDHGHDIAMAALHALNRCAYMEGPLDSSDLISLIRQMNDVVYVSAKPDHPPTSQLGATGDSSDGAEDSDGSVYSDSGGESDDGNASFNSQNIRSSHGGRSSRSSSDADVI
ncbi:hypothetical protein PT974_07800 [Cladobotryum mycophilum]|uniref:Uncharacterized protein n=1 Tax=Cladobotryum mycophilum TaxID=491253 RepID=A0ABR0SHZ6_9HYPO